jgi:hypothetical protein
MSHQIAIGANDNSEGQNRLGKLVVRIATNYDNGAISDNDDRLVTIEPMAMHPMVIHW